VTLLQKQWRASHRRARLGGSSVDTVIVNQGRNSLGACSSEIASLATRAGQPPFVESFGVCRVRLGQHCRACRHALLGQPVVNIMRGQQAEPSVAVLRVVPRKEDVAVRAGILDRAEALWG
jgi:hypothetical protein